MTSYRHIVCSAVNLSIVQGDLLDQDVDVIVNAWNRNIIPWWLLLPQGVSGAIKRRGGLAPFRELTKHGPIPLGGAALTSPGRLPFIDGHDSRPLVDRRSVRRRPSSPTCGRGWKKPGPWRRSARRSDSTMGSDDWRKLLCPKCHQLKRTCTCSSEPLAPSKSIVVRVGRRAKYPALASEVPVGATNTR